jgi:glycosyltransferase involved in cell wall biosynthesis
MVERMRFHVVSLPHTNTTSDFSECAYTSKVINFCRMMTDRGHAVFLYSGEKNSAQCHEHIVCIDEQSRLRAVGRGHYTSAPFDASLPQWQTMSASAVREIRKRAMPQDFLCLIGGSPQRTIMEQLPGMTAVEFGVGYAGVFSNHRVFESYAWMHMHYGWSAARAGQDVSGTGGDGRFYDVVIPGYLDPSQFPYLGAKDDYLLYVGRRIERKGLGVAIQTAEAAGRTLVVAGQGDYTPRHSHVEYVGSVGPEERGSLMSKATALLAPTLYVEPFGNVAVEAQACGTPVISTDWGAFTETVADGLTGRRCRTLQEFVDAVQWCADLTPAEHQFIRDRAVTEYSLLAVGRLYEAYFERLLGLWGEGWGHLEKSDAEQLREVPGMAASL